MPPTEHVELPESVRDEISYFTDTMPWDDNMLKMWRIPLRAEEMKEHIGRIYL